MYSQAWLIAAGFQVIITLVAMVIATRVLRVGLVNALLAALLCNNMPIATPPGFATRLFVHDFMAIALSLALLAHFGRLGGRLLWVGAGALLLIPTLGVAVGLAAGDYGDYSWATFVFRRYAMLVWFAVALVGLFRRAHPRGFMEACTVIWIGMALFGIVQFFGWVGTGFSAEDSRFASTLVAEAGEQVGFLGLNRGAAGLWGGTFLVFNAAYLLFGERVGAVRGVLYGTAIAVSAAAIFIVGSRTGMAAALGGLGFLAIRGLFRLRELRLGRAVTLGAAALVGVVLFVIPIAAVITGRLEGALSSGSFQARLEVQARTVQFVLSDLRPFLFGMGGGGGGTFRQHIGLTSHPHSEYFQVLWDAGVFGFALYMVFLLLLFLGVRGPRLAEDRTLSTAAQAMLVVGMISGAAVGHLLVVSERLAPFGMLMLFFYGLTITYQWQRAHLAHLQWASQAAVAQPVAAAARRG